MRLSIVSHLPSLVLLSTNHKNPFSRASTTPITTTTTLMSTKSSSSAGTTTAAWTAGDAQQAQEAASQLDVWPLDEYNAALLNEVHPRGYVQSCETPHEEYDLIAIGSGAGGLVSSKQVRIIYNRVF